VQGEFQTFLETVIAKSIPIIRDDGLKFENLNCEKLFREIKKSKIHPVPKTKEVQSF
jgi:hypothetical protein